MSARGSLFFGYLILIFVNDFSLETVDTPNLPATPMPANVQPNITNQAQAVDPNTNLTSRKSQ